MKRTGTKCQYHCHWMPAKDHINSSTFKDKKKINIKPDFCYLDQKFTTKEVFLGPLSFDVEDVDNLFNLL